MLHAIAKTVFWMTIRAGLPEANNFSDLQCQTILCALLNTNCLFLQRQTANMAVNFARLPCSCGSREPHGLCFVSDRKSYWNQEVVAPDDLRQIFSVPLPQSTS